MTPMIANPISEERAPASALLERIETSCGASIEKMTSANRVLITGPICGDPGPEGVNLKRTSAINATKGVTATVITDLQPNRYTTDVPLAMGRNSIRLEFSYADGKTETFDVNITRN
jgi:hypothetical protein